VLCFAPQSVAEQFLRLEGFAEARYVPLTPGGGQAATLVAGEAEDTLRFYALRLREAGLIKMTPNEIIAGGTDWRFLNELKRELKA